MDETNIEEIFEPVLFMTSDLECCGYSLYLACKDGQYGMSRFGTEGLRIEIGVICEWEKVVENLMHELIEIYLMKEGKRFVNSKEPREFASINCVFMFNHTELQRMSCAIGSDIAKLYFELHNKWEELNDLFVLETKKNEKKQKKGVKNSE